MAHYYKKPKQKNQTLTHEYIRNQLEGQEGETFIKDFIALAKKHPPKKYEYYLKHEVYIKKRRRRMDTVIFLHVCSGKTLTIGIEIKGHRRNLIWDNKLFEYLGHTDFFFLAVPTALIKPARLKASQDPHIGIIRMRDGKIIVFPERQDVPQEYRDEVNKRSNSIYD